MDPFTLLLLGGGALLLLSRFSSSGTGTAVASGGNQTSPAPPAQPQASTGGLTIPQLGGAAGIVTGTAAAAVAAYQEGGQIDAIINPNSSATSKIVAGVAATTVVVSLGAIALVAAVAAGALSVLGPIGAILIAVALLTYASYVVGQDLARLQYGQAGARKDYMKQKAAIIAQCQDSVAIGQPVVSQAQIDRQLVPFVEGWTARLNWTSYQQWLSQKNLIPLGAPDAVIGALGDSILPMSALGHPLPGTGTQLTSELQYHVNYAIDRGYFLGVCEGMRSVGSDDGGFGADATGSFLSLDPTWIQNHCPTAELQQVEDSASEAAVAANNATLLQGLSSYALPQGGIIYVGDNLNPGSPYVGQAARDAGFAQANVPLLENGWAYYPAGFGLVKWRQPALIAQTPIYRPIDPKRMGFFIAGYVYGNFSIYKAAAAATVPPGNVTSLRQQAGKFFEGTINDDGSLSYQGATFHWNAPAGQGS